MTVDDPTEAERRLMDAIRQSPEITAAIEQAEVAGHTGGRQDRPARRLRERVQWGSQQQHP